MDASMQVGNSTLQSELHASRHIANVAVHQDTSDLTEGDSEEDGKDLDRDLQGSSSLSEASLDLEASQQRIQRRHAFRDLHDETNHTMKSWRQTLMKKNYDRYVTNPILFRETGRNLGKGMSGVVTLVTNDRGF